MNPLFLLVFLAVLFLSLFGVSSAVILRSRAASSDFKPFSSSSLPHGLATIAELGNVGFESGGAFLIRSLMMPGIFSNALTKFAPRRWVPDNSYEAVAEPCICSCLRPPKRFRNGPLAVKQITLEDARWGVRHRFLRYACTVRGCLFSSPVTRRWITHVLLVTEAASVDR